MRVVRFLLLGCIGLLLAGCDRFSAPQTVSLASHSVSLSHQPDPLQVGLTARLKVALSGDKGWEPQTCKVSYRRFMPEMAMADDSVSVAMSVDSAGVYHAETATFSMAGEWVFEVTIDCGEGPASHPFSYRLEWPE